MSLLFSVFSILNSFPYFFSSGVLFVLIYVMSLIMFLLVWKKFVTFYLLTVSVWSNRMNHGRDGMKFVLFCRLIFIEIKSSAYSFIFCR